MAKHSGDRENHSAAGAGSDAGSESVDQLTQLDLFDDLFDLIARHVLQEAALITAPGSIDPRWAGIIAQAYRRGIADLAGRSPGGILFRLEDGGMSVIQLE